MFAELVSTSKVISTESSISTVLFRTWRTRLCIGTSYVVQQKATYTGIRRKAQCCANIYTCTKWYSTDAVFCLDFCAERIFENWAACMTMHVTSVSLFLWLTMRNVSTDTKRFQTFVIGGRECGRSNHLVKKPSRVWQRRPLEGASCWRQHFLL